MDIEFARGLIDDLRRALKDGTARDPQYCSGMIYMLEYKIKKETTVAKEYDTD